MNNIILKIQNSLDSIKKIDKDFEYWSARELMEVLGYSEWRKFFGVIEKAKESCDKSGQNTKDHFVGAANMVSTGSGAKRNISEGRALADFDTHVELKAKDFSLAMTDHNIKEQNLREKI